MFRYKYSYKYAYVCKYTYIIRIYIPSLFCVTNFMLLACRQNFAVVVRNTDKFERTCYGRQRLFCLPYSLQFKILPSAHAGRKYKSFALFPE